jgi:hypothetical protein
MNVYTGSTPSRNYKVFKNVEEALEEVEKYKSPSGNSINEAIIKSIRLYEKYI